METLSYQTLAELKSPAPPLFFCLVNPVNVNSFQPLPLFTHLWVRIASIVENHPIGQPIPFWGSEPPPPGSGTFFSLSYESVGGGLSSQYR